MKKIVLTLFVIIPVMVFAQGKPVKPSLTKAESLLREGKLDEAKSMIDLTVTSQEFMVDKKGQPSKNAAKAWYLKGLVYFAIDTTSKQQFKSLDPNPFNVGKESFAKCKEIDGGKSASFINDANGFAPLLENQIDQQLGNRYFNMSVVAFNAKTDDKDKKVANLKSALELGEKTLYFLPKDTLVLYYTGGAFAPAAKEYDKSIALLQRYIAEGGKLPEAYTAICGIYTDQKKDNVSALKTLQEGKAKYPKYKDFTLLELNIYLGEKKYDVARKLVDDELKSDSANVSNNFLFAQLNRELGEPEIAKKAFKKVLKLDPKNFDAATELALLYWADAKKIKDEMGKLSMSKADKEKLIKLDAQYVEKLKIYLPYLEACEQLSPDDIPTLYSLLNVYSDFGDQPKIARVKKRLKALGEDIN